MKQFLYALAALAVCFSLWAGLSQAEPLPTPRAIPMPIFNCDGCGVSTGANENQFILYEKCGRKVRAGVLRPAPALFPSDSTAVPMPIPMMTWPPFNLKDVECKSLETGASIPDSWKMEIRTPSPATPPEELTISACIYPIKAEFTVLRIVRRLPNGAVKVEVLGDAEKVSVYHGKEGLIFEAHREGTAR